MNEPSYRWERCSPEQLAQGYLAVYVALCSMKIKGRSGYYVQHIQPKASD